MKNFHIISLVETDLIKEVGAMLEERQIKMIFADNDLRTICDLITEKNAEALIIELSNHNTEILSKIAYSLNSHPDLFVIANKEDDTEWYENNENTVVIHDPVDPHNFAMMLELVLKRNEEENLETRKQKIDGYVTKILLDGCITPDSMGFYYMRDAIIIYITKYGFPCSMKKTLYAEISRERGATVANIDRCIRSAILKCWEVSPHAFRLKYFGMLGVTRSRKPSPKEFVITIAERVIRDIESGRV